MKSRIELGVTVGGRTHKIGRDIDLDLTTLDYFAQDIKPQVIRMTEELGEWAYAEHDCCVCKMSSSIVRGGWVRDDGFFFCHDCARWANAPTVDGGNR